MNSPKNISESVRRRLLNGARERGDNFNLVLTRYAIERLLFRLGQSQHSDRFILKGAALYTLWQKESAVLPYRPTRDLDLWGSGSPSVESVTALLREVLLVPTPDDGIEFLPDSIRGQEMRQEEEYQGCRLTVEARLGTARTTVQIDFGFGDVITPAPRMAQYPTLLADSPSPRLQVYPRETVVAEKFEAMVSLGFINTRMKDFFDVWMLSQHFEFNGELLRRAVRATFQHRGTLLPVSPPPALTPTFSGDPAKNTAWRSFGQRSEISDLDRLEVITEQLEQFLMPVASVGRLDEPWKAAWLPSKGWQMRT